MRICSKRKGLKNNNAQKCDFSEVFPGAEKARYLLSYFGKIIFVAQIQIK
jgi:hypothetical protein